MTFDIAPVCRSVPEALRSPSPKSYHGDLRASPDWVIVFMKSFIATVLKRSIQTACLYCFLFFLASYPTILAGHISLANPAYYLCFPI
jgi:hypothetical protein